MLRRSVLWNLCTLVLAFLVSTCGEPTAVTVKGEPAGPLFATGIVSNQQVSPRWSDASTWPSGRVPVAGEEVHIPAGRTVVLDISPPPLAGLSVDGVLEFARKDVDLTTDWIAVGGTLQIGSITEPFAEQATITLTGPRGSSSSSLSGMGSRVLGVRPGATLELHGEQRVTWSRLNATAHPGSQTIEVSDAVDWRVGERIVVAPSGFDPYEAEDRTITSVSGRTIGLDTPLNELHYGRIQSIAGWQVDERAEVGLLSRSIRIQGGPGSDLGQGGFGGHVMVLAGSVARIEGVEFYQMGQSGELARYPMHWHMAGDVGGQYFRGNSVWRSNNRCLTIHATDNLDVRDNVCYDHQGHGYFLEDGAESGNHLQGNLGLLGRRPDPALRLLPSDSRPATFWVTNPDNDLIGNAAAGSEGIGFWYAFPQSPTGPSAGEPDLPRSTPLGAFRDNVAHTNHRGGLFVDHGPDATGKVRTTSYRPVVNPADPDSDPVPAVFDRFTGYKNRERAVWLRGHNHVLRDAVLADNAIGATFASVETYMDDGLIAGETDNNLQPRDVYRGFEFYDGRVGAKDVTFWGFTGAGTIPWSALGFHRKNAFALDVRNWAENLSFIQSTPVYVEPPLSDKDGDKAAVFMDADGSVTGTPGAYVVANTSFLTTAGCQVQQQWNAQVCPGPYVRLNYSGDQAVAPATVRRSDGAQETFTGLGDDPKRLSISMLQGEFYDLGFSRPPTSARLDLWDGKPGDWVRVSLPYNSSSLSISRDFSSTNLLVAVSSVAALDASDGEAYYYDAAARRLHLKLVVRAGRKTAHVKVDPA